MNSMDNMINISEYALEQMINAAETKGYEKAMRELNTPMAVIQKNYEPSKCLRCGHGYSDYEDCDDGYYDRATSLERCPYCGQKLDWYADVPEDDEEEKEQANEEET